MQALVISKFFKVLMATNKVLRGQKLGRLFLSWFTAHCILMEGKESETF